MRRAYCVLAIAACCAVLAWASIPVHATLGSAPQAAPVAHPAEMDVAAQRAMLQRYCLTCHSDRQKAGGLSLAGLDVADVETGAATWEKVIKKLRAGLMPPAGAPRPDGPVYGGMLRSLETALDRVAELSPNPGRSEAMHRLNRAEYQNAVRDLLGVDVDVATQLPADDASYGFDNIAGVLRVSPTLIERYLSVAKKVTRLAVGSPPLFPELTVVRVPDDLPQNHRRDGLPFGTRGGTLINHHFPVDGEYEVSLQLARQTGGDDLDIPAFDQPQEVEISLDGERVTAFVLPASAVPEEQMHRALPPDVQRERRRRAPGDGIEDRSVLDKDWKVRFRASAGPRQLAVAFTNPTTALLETPVEPFQRPWPFGNNQWSTTRGAHLRSVSIAGPFSVEGPGNAPSRQRIFSCHPSEGAEEVACARAILSKVARRAFRRSVDEDDVKRLLASYDLGRADGGFEAGIELALQRVLISPDFLFRIEAEPATVAPGAVYHLSDFELASRLSFFLWSSLPDEALLDQAAAGKLKDPVVLEQQVRRMLADDRSSALVSNFAGQWLYLRNVPALAPDPMQNPDFDDGLRQALRRETELFIEHIIRKDRSILELLTADYTFVNERLARHYGIPNIVGPRFRQVTLLDDNRRGLLGHGSILGVTSYANRTSPVLRGEWILKNILGTPAPEPPPNVPALQEAGQNRVDQTLKIPSVRERLEEHRSNPVCSSCHKVMDPLGFALENFDASGRFRTHDEFFNVIDTSGVFADGTPINGPVGLREALLKHSDQFVEAVIEKLFTYALGRGMEHYDFPAVRKARNSAASRDYSFGALILGIVNSEPFQMRKAQVPTPARTVAERP